MIVACILLAALLIWAIWANKALELSLYTVTSQDLPEEFHGFRIAQVSDLHNDEMGQGNENLLSMLRAAQPDVVVITGDLLDSRRTDTAVALEFVRQLVQIAPCYYVTGNHELRLEEYPDFAREMKSLGVTILTDQAATIEKDGKSITLLGLNDPLNDPDEAQSTTQRLQQLIQNTTGYRILLSHRPELFDVYVESGVDLVLSGHAHGGQFRLPFVGGLFAPNQGLFPEYDAGVYTREDTHMIVSRGIGASIIPLRLNNRPEVVLVELAIS